MYSTGYNQNEIPAHLSPKPAPMLSPMMPIPTSPPPTHLPAFPMYPPGPYPLSPYSNQPPPPMIYNPTAPPLLYQPGPYAPYPQHTPPPPLVQEPPPQPVEITEVKKGRLYATFEGQGSQGFHCVLTSDGKMAFHAGDKASQKPKGTFTITPKSELKLDGGGLTVVREDGQTLVLNAISATGIKEWYDVIHDLQKQLKLLQPRSTGLSISAPTSPSLSPSSSGGSASLKSNTKLSATNAHRRNSAELPMNYDSELIPVPPRPKNSSLRTVGPRSGLTVEKVLAAEEASGEVGVPPRPGSPSKPQKLKRSSSMSGGTAKELNKLSPQVAKLQAAKEAKASEGKSDEASSSPGSSSSSSSSEQSKESEERAKTQGAVRHRKGNSTNTNATTTETPSVEELMRQIHQLTVKNEQLEKAVAKLGDKPAGGGGVQPGGWSAISIDFRKDHVEYHERLGGGGSGATVFRASVKGFSFAAKILSTAYHQPEEIEPLLREISIMTRLQHENIVRYLGSEATNSEIRLFMELYSGTLRDVIEASVSQGKKFAKKDVTNYVFQITKGLNYLHTQDPPVIHRDLKSDNIFVTWDGQRNPKNLRIGDFDVSKVMSAGKMAFTQNIGTPGFIAPEVFSQTQPTKEVGHDTHADIWSLGMIMFEIITLKRPYFDMPFLKVSEANATGTRPNLPDDVDKEDFKDLIKLFEKCTRKIPSKRPTAKRLLSSLGQL